MRIRANGVPDTTGVENHGEYAKNYTVGRVRYESDRFLIFFLRRRRATPWSGDEAEKKSAFGDMLAVDPVNAPDLITQPRLFPPRPTSTHTTKFVISI